MSNALDGAFDYDPSQEEIKPTTVADDRFRLISTLISTPDALSAGAKEFKALETLIRSDFLKLAAGVGIPGESALYNELLVLLSDLRDLIEFPHLANKNVLAIGGGFSSGKSGFLNAILGETDLLPEGIRETTAIPTYLTHADEESILALNTFDRTQRLTRAELTAISHAFNAGQSEESKIQFYHILKLIQIQSPCMKWRNVALLDTPGYSKPNIGDAAAEGTNAGNTDEEKAREHLSLADHLIWSIAGKDGVLQGPDIAFLRDKVQWPRPFYLLINKCDELAKSDVKGIFDGSLAAAKAAGFEIAGASAFSARTGKVYCGDDPRKWFDEIDGKCKFTQWRGRFKAVVEKVIRFNDDEEKRCSALEKSLKPVYLKADGVLTPDQIDAVKSAMSDVAKERKAHAVAAQQFISFGQKVESRLMSILKNLGVSDETAAAVGLEATSTSDEKLLALKKGDKIAGKVEKLSKFLGCFINSPAASDQIRIKYKEIERHYTSPEESFAVGTQVELTVYEVQYSDKRVVFTVVPVKSENKASKN